MRREFGYRLQAFPIDRTRVAKAQTGSNPHTGRDSRAKDSKESECPGCKRNRARNDWEHTREIGQCSFPCDEPWIPDCEACQKRLPRSRAATRPSRRSRGPRGSPLLMQSLLQRQLIKIFDTWSFWWAVQTRLAGFWHRSHPTIAISFCLLASLCSFFRSSFLYQILR